MLDWSHYDAVGSEADPANRSEWIAAVDACERAKLQPSAENVETARRALKAVALKSGALLDGLPDEKSGSPGVSRLVGRDCSPCFLDHTRPLREPWFEAINHSLTILTDSLTRGSGEDRVRGRG